MIDHPIFSKFKAVDTLLSPKSLHSGTNGYTELEKDLLLQMVSRMEIDSKILHSVAIDYLSSMKASSDEVAKEIVGWLKKNKDFEVAMFKATKEAIVYSTLASVLLPDAYRLALGGVQSIKWRELHKMRRTLFNVGVNLILENPCENRMKISVTNTNSEAFLTISELKK